MEKELVENLDTRKKLIALVRNQPGIHFRELHRQSGLAMGELEYHLNILEKMEIVTKKKINHYSKYYPAEGLGTEDKKILDILRQEMLRDILVFIISNEQVTHGEIAREFKLLKSTTSFYMNKLSKRDLVERKKKGREVHYSVRDPKYVLKLVLVYKKGFGEELVKRVEQLWANM